MKRSWLLVAIAALVGAACSGGGTPGTPGRLSIAVIPKGTSHAFWQSIHAGARKAGAELNVDIAWRGPLREDDRDAQVAEIENAVGRGVSGIVLAPLDDAAMVAPVSAAMRQQHPRRDHRFGAEGRRLRQLRRDRQRGRRTAGRREAGGAARRQRPGDSAQIRRGQRQHDEARRGLPDRHARQPGHRDRQLESVRRRRRGRRVQEGRGDSQPAQARRREPRRSTASSAPTRAARSACCACSRTTGGPAR